MIICSKQMLKKKKQQLWASLYCCEVMADSAVTDSHMAKKFRYFSAEQLMPVCRLCVDWAWKQIKDVSN